MASLAKGYPEDNTSWLLLDKKYGRYYVIRVTMDTFTTGTATVSSTSNNWYRFPAAKNRLHKFKVSLLRDGFQLYSESFKEPLIDAQFNSDRSRFSGTFNDENGGTFDAELRGATDTHVPIYGVCGSGPESSRKYQCTDLMDYGIDAKSCEKNPTNKRAYGELSSCLNSLKPKSKKKSKSTTSPSKPSFKAKDGWSLSACTPMPRSYGGGQKLVTKFFNDFFEPVDIAYVRGSGELVLMETLETGATSTMKTWGSHVFAFFTRESKECLFAYRVEDTDNGVESSMIDLMAKSDKQRVGGKQAACESGNCENGVGRHVYNSGTFTVGKYVNGKREGYSIYSTKSGDIECERTYREDTATGFSVCKTISQGKNFATFFYNDNGKRDEEDVLLRLDETARIVAYQQVAKDPVDDYQRLKDDFDALRELSSRDLREQLSSDFRAIQLPAREAFERYLYYREGYPKDGSIKAECIFGDCQEGFGGYVWKTGDTYTGSWKNGKENGYGISVFRPDGDDLRECEGHYKNGRLSGLSVCLRPKFSTAHASYYERGRRTGDSVSWNVITGEILESRVNVDGKFNRNNSVDVERIKRDWDSMRDSPLGGMRTSFLTKEFLGLKLPSREQLSTWQRERELAEDKQAQIAPKKAPSRLGCISGSCKDGFGSYRWKSGTANTGFYKNRKQDGYSRLLFSSGTECEGNYKDGREMDWWSVSIKPQLTQITTYRTKS